jgi:CheY-like chemotaxis protein
MATLLVVDDRPTNRNFLVTLLGYRGHRLPEAADGAETLEQVRDMSLNLRPAMLDDLVLLAALLWHKEC